MSKLPEDRFQSAAELAAALAATPEGKAALGDVDGPKPAAKPAEATNLADGGKSGEGGNGGSGGKAAGATGPIESIEASRRRRC